MPVRAAIFCGTALAFFTLAGAPAIAAEHDLEALQKRVDELEKAVPRKIMRTGKSAVKLTLSGQVSRLSFFADDGTESGFFHTDNENSSTRWRLVGSARIDDEWTVGTKIEQDVSNGGSSDATIGIDKGESSDVDLRHVVAYIDSKNIGRLWLGKTDAFSNNIVQIDLSGTGIVQYSGRNDIGGSFEFRTDGALGAAAPDGPSIKTVDSQFDGLSRVNLIQYNTPTVNGFKLGVTHVQGDAWDVGGRYSANFKEAGLKVSAGVAYWEFGSRDDDFDSGLGGSISFLHNSGLNLTFAAATQDRIDSTVIDDPVTYYIKPGIQFNLTSLGKTALSIHYGRTDDLDAQNDDFENWGVEIVQNIKPAAMELFAFWELNSLDSDGDDFEDIHIGGIGVRVKF